MIISLLLLVINVGDKIKFHSNFELCTVLAQNKSWDT